MYSRFTRYAIAAALLLAATFCVAEPTAIRTFPMTDHGSIQLNVPTSWPSELRAQPNGDLPTIAFGPAQGATYRVLLTPMAPGKAGPPLPSEFMRQMVERAAQDAKAQAVERSLTIKPLKAGSRSGYYFSATDRAPKPGEYKYMTQGMLGVGELTLTFTILTNDGYEQVVTDALNMIKSAVHLKGKEL